MQSTDTPLTADARSLCADIVARLKRHQGYNVLHPIGFDAFGLPAEQFAIQTGTEPTRKTVQQHSCVSSTHCPASTCRRLSHGIHDMYVSSYWLRLAAVCTAVHQAYSRWRQGPTHGTRPRRTAGGSGSSCAAWASRTTGTGRSPPPTPSITSARRSPDNDETDSMHRCALACGC